jgi:hypothetical protein
MIVHVISILHYHEFIALLAYTVSYPIGIRFLVARANDVEKASVMLKEATEYRKKMKVSTLLFTLLDHYNYS